MKKRFNVIAAAVLALGMVVGMCGCEGQLPQPKTTQRQDAPNLTAKQEKTIRTNILKTLDQCNNDRNIDALGSILEGPELEIRTSELHVAQVTGNLDRKTTIPTDLAQAVISTDSGWPRSVFSITSTTDDQQSKRLLVFRQDSARQNYKLWGVARLFSGVKMPSFEISKTGSEQGTEKDPEGCGRRVCRRVAEWCVQPVCAEVCRRRFAYEACRSDRTGAEGHGVERGITAAGVHTG